MKQQRKPTPPLFNNAGFTLLEIIAVLVIMSILAVVAVPRYFNLQEEARERAFGAGMAEATGRINSYFAQQVLSGVHPNAIDYMVIDTDMGDFSMSVTNGSPCTPPCPAITVTVTGRGPEMSQVAPRTVDIPRPGGL
jgi:prepilin-type N-terminal cleavage/methylation domain-containing protein